MSRTVVDYARSRLRNTWLREVMNAYRHRGLGGDDVVMDCFPKSGSTWLRFMLVQLLMDEGVEQQIRDQRYVPFVGKHHHSKPLLSSGGRLVRSHEQYRPEYAKAIYLVRDGRDVMVSLYWHMKRQIGLELSFDEFLPEYSAGRYTGYGTWQDHVDSWLDSPLQEQGNLLVVRYEDMKEDVRSELERCLQFLGEEVDPQRIDAAIEAGRINAMRKSEKKTDTVVHREKGERIDVVRKGVVGDWQNHFSDESLAQFVEWAGPAMRRLGYEV